jgi:DNA (cytosine-5)-methyltransferase 1
LEDIGINILAANELIKERADLYQSLFPNSKMITGNILDDQVFELMIKNTPKKLDFLIASPPCQGMSIAGKNRNIEQMLTDDRNFLIFKIIDFIQIKSPDFVLIENVPAFFKIVLPFQNLQLRILEILSILFENEYNIEAEVYDMLNLKLGCKMPCAKMK